MRRILKWLASIVALVLLIAAAGVAFLVSGAGLPFVLDQAAGFIERGGASLQTEGARGSLASGVRFDRLRWSDGETTVDAHQVDTAWSLAGLLQRKLVIGESRVGELRLSLPAAAEPDAAQPRQALPMPGSWALPVAVEVQRISVDTLVVQTAGPDAQDIVIRDIAVAGAYADAAYSISEFRASSPWGSVGDTSAHIGAAPPHRLRFETRLQGVVPAPAAGEAAAAKPGGQSQAAAPAGQVVQPGQTGPTNPASTSRRYEASVTADGDLERLSAGVDARALDARAVLRATVQPLEASPLRAADLSIDDLALRKLAPELPEALLQSQLRLRTDPAAGAPPGRWRIEVQAGNAGAGALDRERVPLSEAQFVVLVDDPIAGPVESLALEQIVLRFPGSRQPSELTGTVAVALSDKVTVAGVALPATRADVQIRQLDLGVFGFPGQRTALTGPLTIDRDRFEVSLTQDPGAAGVADNAGGPAGADSVASRLLREEASLRVAGRIDGDALLLEQGRLRMGAAAITASGRASLVEPVSVSMSGSLEKIDLARWLPASDAIEPRFRQGMLSGKWEASGELAPALDASVSLQLENSRFAGQPLAADIGTAVTRGASGDALRISDLDARLRWGENRLEARGALGRANDRATIALQLRDPALLDPRLGGRLTIDAVLTGRLDALRGTADASGQALRWRDGESSVEVGSIALKADVPLAADMPRDANLDFELTARGLNANGNRLERLSSTLTGTLAKHEFKADAAGDPGRLVMGLQGGATLGDAPAWRGRITQLAYDDKLAVRSEGPIDLAVTPERVSLENGLLRIDAGGNGEGRLRIDSLLATLTGGTPAAAAPTLAARGSLAALPVADIVATLTDQKVPAELKRLRLSSRFDLAGSAASDLDGTLALDLGEAPGDGPSVLARRSNEIRMRFDRGRLDGTVDVGLPSLALSRRFTGPDWQIDGALALSGTVGGTVAQPTWNAVLTGQNLSLLQSALGWRLSEGDLRARIDGRVLTLQALSLRTGEGTVALDGQARLLDGPQNASRPDTLPMRGSFRLRTNGFIVPIGPGQQIVLSGDSLIVAADRGLSWDGDMKVDKGRIEIAGSGAPTLPDDVQIVDFSAPTREPAPEPKPSGGRQPGDEGIAVLTSLRIDLGDDLRIVGGGVNARLGGKLQLKGTLPADPRMEGTVEIVEGSYTDYGQDLQITEGSVRFNGPIDNPALNIRAQRPKLPVEVGVAIRGTALSPRVELYSQPSLSDAEKLSWLVLGQPIANAQSGAQSLALKEAASRLIGSDDGSVSGGGFADKLGLDNLGFGFASDTGQTEGVRDSGQPTGLPGAGGRTSQDTYREVVSLGKRLSDRLTVSYEQGVRGVYNLLRVQYELNKRLSLRAQTGTESAVDLLYFWSFD